MESVFFFDLTLLVFFFKQRTAYELRISDWSSDVCSSDLHVAAVGVALDLAEPAAPARRVVRAAAAVEPGGHRMAAAEVGDARQEAGFEGLPRRLGRQHAPERGAIERQRRGEARPAGLPSGAALLPVVVHLLPVCGRQPAPPAGAVDNVSV